MLRVTDSGFARWACAVVVLGWAATAQGAGPAVEESDAQFGCPTCEHGCAHAKQLMGRFGRGLPPTPAGFVQAAAPEDEFTDLLHYNLDIRIDPSAVTIDGSNELTVRSLVNGLETFNFRLQDNYTISAIEVNGTAAQWNRLSPVVVRVTLDQAYDEDEEFVVRVEYNGTPINNGFSSILFSTHAGVPIVSTLSETDFAYTWWPVKDDNRDKSTADLRFTAPAAYSVASNGALISNDLAAPGWREWYWKTEYPTATYLYSFALTNYDRFVGTYPHAGGVMPLEFFIYPEHNTLSNRNAWLATQSMLAAFAPLFGEYPFVNEKYGIYQFPFGGGMEHQTMTGQGTFSESVTAHELGHQWWGDDVTCAYWNDIWLNEGFATYSEALWFENKPGSTGLPALHSAMASRRPTSVSGTIYKYEPLNTADLGTIFSTNLSYRKPAWVLHMLRRIVGAEVFFDILEAYRGMYTGGSATTEDFRAVAEAVAGVDLEWFFEQWIYDDGAPSYQRAWRTFQVNGRWYVELYLRQAQSSSFPIFTMPLEIVSVVGGANVTNVIWNDAKTEHYVFEVAAAATAVNVDPTPWVLATGNSSVSFVQGPPKALEMSPSPGSTVEPDDAQQIHLWFSKNVVAAAGNFSLFGANAGAVPFTFSYSPGEFKATLTPMAPLAEDVYTVVASQNIVDSLSGKLLDGEVDDAADPQSLPSGDGQPGGTMVLAFSVAPPACLGDSDGNGTVDFVDITSTIAHWGESGPLGDADGNGAVDFDDISAIVANWGDICS